MKQKFAVDNLLETPCAQISRREGPKLSAAGMMASLLPVSVPDVTRSETQEEDLHDAILCSTGRCAN
jgi:hypothetical protein